MGGGGSSYGAQSATITIGTTPTDYNIGFNTTSLLMRAASTNTHNINVSLGTYDVLGGSILIRPGESVHIDITQVNMLKIMMGNKLNSDDFITKITSVAGAAGQVFYLDAIGV